MPDDFDPQTVSWVLQDDDLAHFLAAIENAYECIPDLETTGLDEHADRHSASNGGVPARVALGSFTMPTRGVAVPTTYVVPLSHPDSPWCGKWREIFKKIIKNMEKNKIPLSNQNMKFDARWIYAHTKVDLSHQIVWDTRVSSALMDETQSTKLKERVPAVFGIERWDDFDLTYPGAAEEVPLFDLGMYAARDTYWTWRLKEHHREVMFLDEGHAVPEFSEEVEAARIGKLATWCAMPSVATMTSIEQRGFKLDVEWVNNRLADNTEQEYDLFADLASRYTVQHDGNPSFAPTSHWFREWTERAVDAGDLVVGALTPSGNAKWDKAVLVRQARNGSKVAEKLLNLRKLTKQSEFLRSWLSAKSPQNIIHTTYNVGSVLSGRLSSSGPNMQQVTYALRPAFVPRAGYVVVDFDYSQIELRVAAFLSRCPDMMRAFEQGDDLHALLASQFVSRRNVAQNRTHTADVHWKPLPSRVDPSDVAPDDRQAGKSANFGLLYDMSAAGFQVYAETAYDVSFTMDEAEQMHGMFFDTWRGIRPWHDKQKLRVHQTGQVVSPIGRVRRLPDILSDNESKMEYAERIAINSPVQGFASDIMQIAGSLVEGTMPGYEDQRVPEARLIGTVHDSIVAEIPENSWKETAAEVLDRMMAVHPILAKMGCEFDVPLAAEAKAGTRWGLDDVGTMVV